MDKEVVLDLIQATMESMDPLDLGWQQQTTILVKLLMPILPHMQQPLVQPLLFLHMQDI
jgi:hypothetical protein